MKLERFKEKNNKKKSIITFTICCVLLIVGAFFYQSFALFETRENFNLINGNVSDPGDLYFAYYVDDVLTYDMPSKDSGYTMSSKSNCTNGVTITWDDESWSAFVNYEKYKIANSSRTKCILYFEKKVIPPNPADAVKDFIIAKATEGTLIEDDGTSDHNLRYIGLKPNNYVSFNNELWRIIGVMNNIDDGTGNKESRIKLIRSTPIGIYSWDSSDSTINSGYGINEWSQADIMKLLNPGYENESVGGSLYWNRGSGSCYNGSYNTTTSCDFSKTGLSDEAQLLISNAVWNLGSNGENNVTDIKTTEFYQLERSNNTGKICTSGANCNDTVERTTTWVGKVGLIYPSDYGHATAGGSTIDRITCLDTYLASIKNSGDCLSNNWIYYEYASADWLWTMMPTANSAQSVFIVGGGNMNVRHASQNYRTDVMPVIYLSSSVQIISGEGTRTSPFILSNA